MGKLAMVWALGLATALSGCSLSEPELEQLAQCKAAGTTAQRGYEMGYVSRTQSPAPDVLSQLNCKGSWAYAFGQLDNRALASKFNMYMSVRPDFRRGYYAALAPKGAPEQVAHRTGQIGELLEKVGTVRNKHLECTPSDAVMAGTVAQFDEAFVIAALSRYAEYSFDEDVKSIASKFNEAIKEELAKLGDTDCSEASKKDYTAQFNEHVKQWQQFAAGTHPWLPGCKLSNEGDSFRLQC